MGRRRRERGGHAPGRVGAVVTEVCGALLDNPFFEVTGADGE